MYMKEKESTVKQKLEGIPYYFCSDNFLDDFLMVISNADLLGLE